LNDLEAILEVGMLRVDIGCGDSKPDGFIGVDICPGDKVDIVADISQAFPFEDDSVDELRAYDIIEHLPDRLNTMNEIWRVCKPGARVDILVPSTDGRGAFQDPTHISFWNINSFRYYAVQFPAYYNLCKKYGFKGAFQILRLEHYASADEVVHVQAILQVVKPAPESIQIPQNEFIDHSNQSSHASTELMRWVEEYQNDPFNESLRERLIQVRRELAERILRLSDDAVEPAYTQELATIHQALLQSKIQYLPLAPDAADFLGERLASIWQGLTEPGAIQSLLVAMLYQSAENLHLISDVQGIPSWLLMDYLKFVLAAPSLFLKNGDAERYYQYFKGWVDYFHAYIFANPQALMKHEVAIAFTQVANFMPLYFTPHNLKDLYQKRAEIIEYVLKQEGCTLDYEFPERPSGRKIRLGILAHSFLPNAETFATLPFYEYISREFEVILYPMYQTRHPLEQYCQTCANAFKPLPEDLQAKVNLIRSDDLDILFIGTNVTAVTNPIAILASHRLARIQVTSGASVTTTGIRHIDYFLSGDMTDSQPDAQQHYQETLLQLQCSAQCFSYGNEAQTSELQMTRMDLGIPEDAIVFVSGANFYKLLPELLEAWAKIIRAVPNSVLLLFPYGPNWSNRYPKALFVQHVRQIFEQQGLSGDRLIIADPQPVPNLADLKQYFKLADIYLDSYPFAGTSSLMEPLSVGLPVVCKKGGNFRSAMGAAILESAGLGNWFTDNEAAYMKSAIALGNDVSLRTQWQQQLQEKMRNNPGFLNSRGYAAQAGEIFQAMVESYQKQAIARRSAANVQRHSMRGGLTQIRSLNFAPQTVIDVGAALGTFDLYETFPDAEHILIEPVVENEPYLIKICQKLKNASYLIAAATEQSGEIMLTVNANLIHSSADFETHQPTAETDVRRIPAITLDQLCVERNLTPPYLLKIDVDGNEVDVLRGATRMLQQTEYVIIEVSLFNQIHKVIDFMRSQGFVIYDILDLAARPTDQALWQADMAFVKESGIFRQDKNFIHQEQEPQLAQHLKNYRESCIAHVETHYSEISPSSFEPLFETLQLRDINLIAFPDWQLPEPQIYQALMDVLSTAIAHPDRSRLKLLIDTNGTDEETANWMLSDVAMQLGNENSEAVGQDEPEVLLLEPLNEVQWQELLPHLTARIQVDGEDPMAIARFANLPVLVH
jgi:FkbM family methyltransferase